MKHEIQNLKEKYQKLSWWLKFHDGEIILTVIVAIIIAAIFKLVGAIA